jgi:hypothetical protein
LSDGPASTSASLMAGGGLSMSGGLALDNGAIDILESDGALFEPHLQLAAPAYLAHHQYPASNSHQPLELAPNQGQAIVFATRLLFTGQDNAIGSAIIEDGDHPVHDSKRSIRSGSGDVSSPRLDLSGYEYAIAIELGVGHFDACRAALEQAHDGSASNSEQHIRVNHHMPRSAVIAAAVHQQQQHNQYQQVDATTNMASSGSMPASSSSNHIPVQASQDDTSKVSMMEGQPVLIEPVSKQADGTFYRRVLSATSKVRQGDDGETVVHAETFTGSESSVGGCAATY